ncbi:MAG: hypothetical protein V4511_10655 [Bacteroidota bacterium]
MIHKSKGILFFLLITCFSYAQPVKTASYIVPSSTSGKTEGSVENDSAKKTPPSELIITPTIGLGTGMFSFYGDLYNKHFQAPMVSRLAFDLSVSQPIKEYLQMNLYVLFGKLGANERFAPNNRNLNFETQIRAGGLTLEYNFDHFLPPKRSASPYFSLGIESFEFLSKTDLKDKNDNTYFYWADGSIRNKDEFASDASQSVEIFRDYTYESDVREKNLDGFGKYPERSFAVPVGAGVIFKINDYVNFKMGATMHFTFNDYIDGVTEKSIGNRQGNSKNDNFMMTSFSLHYNLGTSKKGKKKREAARDNEENYRNVDFATLDLDDTDKDGVTDWDDQCQGTPPGVPVDEKGCPLDGDNDGIPNYKDDELKSPKGALVSTRGVKMSDSLIAYQYNFYMDSTGSYGLVDNRDPISSKLDQKEYTVELGTFKKGLPPNLMTKFLSISDISSAAKSDSATIYTAGKFDNIKDAEKRKQQLISEGLTDAKVVYKLNSKYYDLDAIASAKTGTETSKKDKKLKDLFKGTFIGEDKTPLANSKVNLVNENGEILQTTTTDGMGAFHFDYLTPDQNVLFVLDENDTQLKKLKKVYLADAKGSKVREVFPNKAVFSLLDIKKVVSPIASVSKDNKNTSISSSSALNAPGVVLRVQLGAYKKKLSKAVFKDINDLIEIRTEDGLYKYMTGSFKSIDDAAKLKVEMILNGYPGAFIAAYKDGKRITLQEAGATLANKEDVIEAPDNNALSAVNKKLVKFKVQVGVFKNTPPDNVLSVFSKLRDLSGEKTSSGLTRYVVGPFNSYKEAEAFKNDILKRYGLSDSFVVATFNNEYISIPEALEILK